MMKVLWISNIAFGKLAELAGLPAQNTSGSWLNAALDAFKGAAECEVILCTVGPTERIKRCQEQNIHYCLLPGGFVSAYDPLSSKNRSAWLELADLYKPDILHIWGTEFTHGLLALRTLENVPAVIYMQGVLSQIARYYLAGMSDQELRASITLRDLLKRDTIKMARDNYYRRSFGEAEMIRLAKNVIVENDWCAIQCKAVEPQCRVFKSKLPIRDIFYQHQWNVKQMETRTIMCNAAGYPIKGLHILLKALKLVVRRFPDVKLYVPGEYSPVGKTFWQKLRQNGYSKYISTLICQLGLENHIEFLGRLTSQQMAERMAKANVFVMPSSIENHSSTLIEAMIVGVPCIASYVGGVPEYLIHKQNGLLYRFEEYEVLAEYIIKVFEDTPFAQTIAAQASFQMRQNRKSTGLKEEFLSIYQHILANRPKE